MVGPSEWEWPNGGRGQVDPPVGGEGGGGTECVARL